MISAVTLLALAASVAPARDASTIRWIENDWARAKKEAIESGHLVAVDVWATWCHTCLSMKNYVLTSAALKPVAGEHTFLDLDFDRPENAAFFEKFPVAGFPTYLIVDPKSEAVVDRWIGSGTAEQIAAFLKAAGRDTQDALILGNRALARRDFASARPIFEAALQDKSADAARRTRLAYGLVESLSHLEPRACAQDGLRYAQEAEASAPGVDLTLTVASCAENLAPEEKTAVLKAVRDRLSAIAASPAPHLSVDDRSGLLAALFDIHESLGEHDRANAVAKSRLELLEGAARAAKTPALRATFDAHRLEEYLRAKRYADAEKMLLASERAQPRDFNHPWRLSRLYLEQGKTKPGLAAVERALARGYGPRRLRIYATKADLLVKEKRWRDARAAVDAGLAEAAKLGAGRVRESWLRELEGKREVIAQGEKAQ